MTAAVTLQDPRFNFGEQITTDKLVALTCNELSRLGFPVAPARVHRLVHRWVERVRWTGFAGYAEYIAAGIAKDAEKQARAAWGLRNRFGVVDPVGQWSAQRVDRQLHLGEGWHE